MRRRGDESRRPQNHRHQDEEGWIESDFMRWMMLMMRAVTFRNIRKERMNTLRMELVITLEALLPPPPPPPPISSPRSMIPPGLLLSCAIETTTTTTTNARRLGQPLCSRCLAICGVTPGDASASSERDPIPASHSPRTRGHRGRLAHPSRGLTEENVFIKAPVNRTWIHERRRPHAPARLDDCPPRESKQLWSL
jgi:hypothetical protein